VLFGASLFTFSILHLVPGDPVAAMLGRQAVTGARAEELRAQLGLNDPLPVQYLRYVGGLLQGDMGTSIRNKQPVATLIAQQLPSTLQLAAAALVLAVTAGLLLGILAALRRNTWVDVTITTITVAGVSTPSFWLGMLLILLFSMQLGWLPATSARGDWRGLILPAVTLAVAEAAVIARVTRATMVDELDRTYVSMARAKGLRERLLVRRHLLPNVLIPVLTVVGLQAGFLLAGAFVVESVFARQGLGRLAVSAIENRDYPLVQGVALTIAATYVIINTAVDLTYAWLDPRIRLQ
jgi:ABC-type dipeptide/oligopeptide/nickel transport system permease component